MRQTCHHSSESPLTILHVLSCICQLRRRFGAGSVLMADEKLILMGDTGKLTIAKLSSQSFRPIVQRQVLEGITWTPAALADGKLYVRNRTGKAICLRIGEQTN